jgi:hypothetical protein
MSIQTAMMPILIAILIILAEFAFCYILSLFTYSLSRNVQDQYHHDVFLSDFFTPMILLLSHVLLLVTLIVCLETICIKL